MIERTLLCTNFILPCVQAEEPDGTAGQAAAGGTTAGVLHSLHTDRGAVHADHQHRGAHGWTPQQGSLHPRPGPGLHLRPCSWNQPHIPSSSEAWGIAI